MSRTAGLPLGKVSFAPMYLRHYGLDEAPFSITPDPRFVFLSDRHRDALAHLVYGISQGGGGGFVQLTGEVGTGKTTLSRLLLEQLPPNTQVALVLNPRLDPVELLETICEELGVDIADARGSGKALVDVLNRYLLKAHADGIRVVLMLDEAQQMSVDSLEQVRLLTNLETATQKLLQIVLLGQPELRRLLERDDLRQLAQRITARYHLTPLSADETAAYVRHRLAVAGQTRPVFEPGALKALHRHSGGVPRLINVIAERALLAGYAAGRDRLDARLIDRAAAELQVTGDGDTAVARWPYTTVIAVILAALVAIALLAWNHAPAPAVDQASAEAEAGTIVETEPPVTLAELMRDSGDGARAAEALAARWQLGDEVSARLADCPFRLDPRTYCLRSRGTLAQLAQLDRPVLLLLPEADFVRALALTALDADTATLAGAGVTHAKTLPRSQLEAAWPGEYLALMRVPTAVATLGTGQLPDWAMNAVARFEANRSLPALSESVARIQRLQQAFGLRADGLVGPETWWVLSAHIDGGPRLTSLATPPAAEP